MKKLSALICTIFLIGCSGSIDPPSKYTEVVVSPDGTAELFVCELQIEKHEERTDLLLYQKNRSGASGAITFSGVGLNLQIKWIDNENLKILYPKHSSYERNASGETIQFLDRKVRIQLEAFEKTDSESGSRGHH